VTVYSVKGKDAIKL